MIATCAETRDELRNLSYEVVGNDKRSNCIIYLHGVLSSRYEALGFSKVRFKRRDQWYEGKSHLHPGLECAVNF